MNYEELSNQYTSVYVFPLYGSINILTKLTININIINISMGSTVLLGDAV